MARTFTARYDGFCRGCAADIEAGDEIGYIGDEIRCGDCMSEAVVVADLPPLVICPKCFLTSCDCARADR